MREDTNFKASDVSCSSVWSLFCDIVLILERDHVAQEGLGSKGNESRHALRA